MSEPTQSSCEKRLPYFPVAFFASVMGSSGLTIAWTKFQHVTHFEIPFLSLILTGLVSALFLTLLGFYLAKLIRYPQSVIEEIHHPVKINFLPTISVSLILLSIIYMEPVPALSHGLWIAGTVLHFMFSLYIINVWIHHKHFEIQHMNPAWMIPPVGNILIPIAGVYHGHIELSWFFFSVGLLFWVTLTPIIFYRIMFHHPIPARLMPTLFILIAPPAVGFISYVNLTGQIDGFARFLLYAGLFLTFLLAAKIAKFSRLQFFLSWWAYSFPIAAISIANMLMYQKTENDVFLWIGGILLAALSGIVGLLTVLTTKAAINKQICQAGH